MKTKKPLVKILLCDDDPADRKLARAYLQQIDHMEIALLEAGQKDEIQDALHKGRIDLVFLDIQMPEKSGLEWLAEIVARQTAPVVMLTGSGSEEVAVQSLLEGAVGYLPKGTLSAEKLAKTIDDALKRWQQIQQSRANQEELERLANIDTLTGLLNRGAILYRLGEQVKHARRYQEKLSISLLDIDHFKKVNDRYGHLAGDDVLEKVGVLLNQNTRDADFVGRYGGEEFIIVLPRTDMAAALTVAERVRGTIELFPMKDPERKEFTITVSQGIAAYQRGEDEHSLISRADSALYKAKENGRNRIETSDAQSMS